MNRKEFIWTDGHEPNMEKVNWEIYRYYSPKFYECISPRMIQRIKDLDYDVTHFLGNLIEHLYYFQNQPIPLERRLELVTTLIPKIYCEKTVDFQEFGSPALNSLLSLSAEDQDFRKKLCSIRHECLSMYAQLDPNVVWGDHASFRICEEFVDGIDWVCNRFNGVTFLLIEKYCHPDFERYLNTKKMYYEDYWKKIKDLPYETEWDYIAISFAYYGYQVKGITEKLRPSEKQGVTSIKNSPFPFIRNVKLEEFDHWVENAKDRSAPVFEYLDFFFTEEEAIEKIQKFLPQIPSIASYISQNENLINLCTENEIDLVTPARQQFFKRGVLFAGLRHFNHFYPNQSDLSEILEDVVCRRIGVRKSGGNFTTYQVKEIKVGEEPLLIDWLEGDPSRIPVYNILDLLLQTVDPWEIIDRNLEKHPEILQELPWMKVASPFPNGGPVFELKQVDEIMEHHPNTFPYLLDSILVYWKVKQISFDKTLHWYDQYLMTLPEKKRQDDVLEGGFSAAKSRSYQQVEETICFQKYATEYEKQVLYTNSLEMRLLVDRYYPNYVASLNRAGKNMPEEAVRLRHFFRSVFATPKVLSKLIEMPNVSLSSLQSLISYTYGDEKWTRQIDHPEQITHSVQRSYATEVNEKRRVELSFFNEFSDAKRKQRLPELFEKYEQYGDLLKNAVFTMKTLDQKQKRSLLEIINQREIYLQLGKMEEIVDEMLLKKCTISEVLKSRNIPVEEFYKAYHASKEINEERYCYVKAALKENRLRGFKKLISFGYVINASTWTNLDEFQEQFPHADLRTISFCLQKTAIGQDLQTRYETAKGSEAKEETFLRELGMKKSKSRTYLTRAIQLTEKDEKLGTLAKEFHRPMEDLYQEMYTALTEILPKSSTNIGKNDAQQHVVDFTATSARYLKEQTGKEPPSKKLTYQYIKAWSEKKQSKGN